MIVLQGLLLFVFFAALFWILIGRRIWKIDWRFPEDPTLLIIAATIIFVFVIGVLIFLAER